MYPILQWTETIALLLWPAEAKPCLARRTDENSADEGLAYYDLSDTQK